MDAETAAIKIYNAAKPGAWTKIADVKQATGLTQAELAAGIAWWMDSDDFRAEPEHHGRRADRASEVMIGGEARHWIRFPA